MGLPSRCLLRASVSTWQVSAAAAAAACSPQQLPVLPPIVAGWLPIGCKDRAIPRAGAAVAPVALGLPHTAGVARGMATKGKGGSGGGGGGGKGAAAAAAAAPVGPPLPPGVTLRKDGVVQVEFGVRPGARSDGIAVTKEGLELRTTAPPRDGEANEDVVEQVAAFFGVAKRAVEIVAGGKSRHKVLGIRGLTPAAVAARIAAGAADDG